MGTSWATFWRHMSQHYSSTSFLSLNSLSHGNPSEYTNTYCNRVWGSLSSIVFPFFHHHPLFVSKLRQYQSLVCVRDAFWDPSPAHEWQGRFSGVFKQMVEWMEWSLMHGLDHFLVYTFEGTDLAEKDDRFLTNRFGVRFCPQDMLFWLSCSICSCQEILEVYLDAAVASRVHFNFDPQESLTRYGYIANDCLWRAKNHARWVLTTVDVDEYVAGRNFLRCWIFWSLQIHQNAQKEGMRGMIEGGGTCFELPQFRWWIPSLWPVHTSTSTICSKSAARPPEKMWPVWLWNGVPGVVLCTYFSFLQSFKTEKWVYISDSKMFLGNLWHVMTCYDMIFFSSAFWLMSAC